LFAHNDGLSAGRFVMSATSCNTRLNVSVELDHIVFVDQPLFKQQSAAILTPTLDEVEYAFVLLDHELQAQFVDRCPCRNVGRGPGGSPRIEK
jgi:hypothetical protein